MVTEPLFALACVATPTSPLSLWAEPGRRSASWEWRSYCVGRRLCRIDRCRLKKTPRHLKFERPRLTIWSLGHGVTDPSLNIAAVALCLASAYEYNPLPTPLYWVPYIGYFKLSCERECPRERLEWA